MAKASRGTPATVVLDRAGIPYEVRSYTHDPNAPSYGMEAAAALGVDRDRIFKTLLVETSNALAVGLVPVDTQLDLKAMATVLGAKKVAMADRSVAERVTGYVAGGISPFGQRRLLPTVLDSSAEDFGTILVSGGKRGLDVELAPEDLLRVLYGSSVADIARRVR